MTQPTPEPVLDERAVECPESCGWDYELFRANLDAGAFDDDSLIAQWGVAHLARHILAKLDSTGDALTEALRERDEARRRLAEAYEHDEQATASSNYALRRGTTAEAALTEAEHRAERAEKVVEAARKVREHCKAPLHRPDHSAGCPMCQLLAALAALDTTDGPGGTE